MNRCTSPLACPASRASAWPAADAGAVFSHRERWGNHAALCAVTWSERDAKFPRGMEAPFQPGAVLAGKYVVERMIGQGGSGFVLAAQHLVLKQRVAVKLLH